jgi:hypothetical protein
VLQRANAISDVVRFVNNQEFWIDDVGVGMFLGSRN